jgi:hypothetical protein
MGQVHIRLDQPNARTTIPTLDEIHFTLNFTSGEKTVNTSLPSNSGLSLTVALESAVWTLTVKGYKGHTDNDIGRLMVQGTSNIPVTAGMFSNVVVDLKPVFSSNDTEPGILSYSVSFPNTVSQAFLSLYSLGAQETYRETAISGSALKTLEDLPVGTYQAFIDLYDGMNNTAAVWTGVVHIYDGSTTSLAKTFTTDNFAACPPVVEASENTLAAKLDAALDSPTGSYTIALDGTETTFVPKDLKVEGGKDITLTIRGNGQTVSLDDNGSNGSLFTLSPDSSSSLILILQAITLEGKDGNTAPVVRVKDGGTLELKAGSSITGNTSNTSGGGVLVDKGGTLSMSGGEISDNTVSGGTSCGGGVYINGGTFTMSSGTISGNKTTGSGAGGQYGGGGVFVTNGGSFTMSGGKVSANTSFYDGGGVFVYGKGNTFEMSGGAVSGNKANYGGGVYINAGTFSMNGGAVSGNSAFNKGGGVLVYDSGTFSMSGGVIYGSGEEDANTAEESGAVLYKYSDSVIPPELVTDGAWDETIDKR